MQIKYTVVVEIFNKVSAATQKFTKQFTYDIDEQEKLYGNEHLISERFYILNSFSNEIDAYCTALNIDKTEIEINEFEIVSLTDKVDIYFEDPEQTDPHGLLVIAPVVKCYVYPLEEEIAKPVLNGKPYDDTTIIWSWEDDGHAHFLVDDIPEDLTVADPHIIAAIPIGRTTYAETGLDPDTVYIRRLISYDAEKVSNPSAACTVQTNIAPITKSLEEFEPEINYDFTADDSLREISNTRLHAFKSGVGYANDLKVYKQMDLSFYEKFKAYFEITGKRYEKENRYEQVGFNYKICMEARETVQEQEGETVFNIEAYPREKISVMEYFWATKPVTVKIKLEADVDLYKETGYTDTESTTETVINKTYPCFAGVHFVFCVDMSSSINDGLSNQIKSNIKSLTDLLFATKIMNPATGQLEYPKYYTSIVGFAKGASQGTTKVHNQLIGTENQDQGASNAAATFRNVIDTELKFGAKAGANSFIKGVNIGNLTNWGAGIAESVNVINSDQLGSDVRKVILFFSDGAHNCALDSKGDPYWVPSIANGRNIDPAYNFLSQIMDSTDSVDDIWALINCTDQAGNVYRTLDESLWYPDGLKGSHANNYVYNISTMISKGAALSGSAEKSPVIKASGNFNWLSGTYQSIIEAYQTPTISVGHETSTEEFENSLNMGEYETAHLIAYLDYVIGEGNGLQSGPGKGYIGIEYDKKERRAVIKTQIPEHTKATSSSMFDIFYPLIKDTAAYRRGYRYTRNHYNGNHVLDGFIMKNLLISDSWIYADEDKIPSIDQINWNKGSSSKTGTINIWTDMNTMGTSDKGDDRYFCSDNNYLYIDGYAEGIIYDGVRYFTTELNAYDHSSEVMVSHLKTYEEYLFNRMNKNLAYSPKTGVINQVLFFLEVGKDIKVTGLPTPIQLQDEYFITNIDHDIVAVNEAVYKSPMLNYRFNILDPDAHTPYYEILPDCDKDSIYKHIVILKVFYAKNLYIWNENNYVALYNPTDGSYKQYIERDQWIDEELWFYAEKMWKEQDYYDEIPGKGINSLYGLVNGRYRDDRKDGKLDLRVDVPEFNIPNTVTEKHSDSIRIYIKITEMSPKDALVSYAWDHPMKDQMAMTQVNGDFVTFSSDAVTVKQVPYTDMLVTYNMTEQEIYGQNSEKMFYSLKKPISDKEYANYYLNVRTDNGDVLALYYPGELFFKDSDEIDVGVIFQGVINSTSRWAPKIHNGYYYINQHEKFAFSEFNVEAEFDTEEEVSFDSTRSYLSVEVDLYRAAKPSQNYSYTINMPSQMIQDENNFEYIKGKGVTLRPYLKGLSYEKYITREYISPVLKFPNVVTAMGSINIGYSAGTISGLMARSFDNETGTWRDWVEFQNNTLPNCPLSNAYQVKFPMSVTTVDSVYSDEDYLACYLDWEDEKEAANTTNIVTITDHLTTGPYKAQGIFVSKVISFLCESSLVLDYYASNSKVQMQIAYSNSMDDMLLENIVWKNYKSTDESSKYLYYRYRLVIPEGEKVYWVYKKWTTLKTAATKDYLSKISYSGAYQPQAIKDRFINVESFELVCDNKEHNIFESLMSIIGPDVTKRGFTKNEIQKVSASISSTEIELILDDGTKQEFPTEASLNLPVKAKTGIKYITQTHTTPFIFVRDGEIKITGTPQNFAPITVEDKDGNSYIRLQQDDFEMSQVFENPRRLKHFELSSNQYDSLVILIDDVEINESEYETRDHLVIFKEPINADSLEARYYIKRSFIADIDYKENTTTLKFYTGKDIVMPDKFKVFFETNKTNNKFSTELSMNPVYRTDYKGFIYITEDHNDVDHINVFCNPTTLYAGGYDKIDVIIEVLDSIGNPVIAKEVGIDCKYGMIKAENIITDFNGVVHVIYKSSLTPTTDEIKVKVIKDDLSTIERTVVIENIERTM